MPSLAALDTEQERALALLRAGERFLLVGHMRPDGDCLGGQAALARGLQGLGKTVTILNADPPAPAFDYLTRELPYAVYAGGPLPAHDVVVLLDFNELTRTGPMAEAIARAPSKKLVVDHHPYEGRPWWDACFVDVKASATGLLVWRILRALGAPVDALVARAVFTSLVTDTGWFRYSNTDAETLALAGELVTRGADPAGLFGALFQRRPAEEPTALAAVLARLEYFAGGRLAVTVQPLGNGGQPVLEDGDPVLDAVRAVGRVEVVLYLRETEPGTCKLSARSKTDFDVNRLARRFGGGGHVKAAGATLRAPLAEARAQVVAAALEMLEGQSEHSVKLAIISDLHSNREALEAVFADIRRRGVTELVCLGDVIGYGPDPEFCVDLVRGHAQWCLMGNHDEALFRDASDFNPHARGAIVYTRRRMQPRWWSSSEKRARWKWLKNLPLKQTVGRFLFVHGSPRDPVREYVLSTDGILNPDKLRAIFDTFAGVGVAGHTHQPGIHDESLRFLALDGAGELTLPLEPGRRYFINVGSTGQPRDGDSRACYAVLEEHQVTWYRVEYDFRVTQDKILRTGVLSEILARRLAVGK